MFECNIWVILLYSMQYLEANIVFVVNIVGVSSYIQFQRLSTVTLRIIYQTLTQRPTTIQQAPKTNQSFEPHPPPFTSTLRLSSWLLTLTSSAGFISKKSTGFNETTNFSTGITGQSSVRGLCVVPNVCQMTISSFLTLTGFGRDRIHDAIPSPPSDCIV